jgi:hypothetical protein
MGDWTERKKGSKTINDFFCVGNVPHNEKWGVYAGERGREGMRVWGGKGAGLGNDFLSFHYRGVSVSLDQLLRRFKGRLAWAIQTTHSTPLL